MNPPNTSASPPKEIFDRQLVRARRARAARDFETYDFLLKRCEEEFSDRLLCVAPERRAGGFGRVLDLGSHKGSAARVLARVPDLNPSLIVQCDLSEQMLPASGAGAFNVVGSDELLPFARGSFDLVLAPLTLQFTNDLAGALVQIQRCLRPGGLFLSALYGGETLSELRGAFSKAEITRDGGLSPRVIPFADIKDYGGLLQRVKFFEPVCDVDKVTVTYSGVKALMHDLRGMALANPMKDRRKSFLKRGTYETLDQIYKDDFGSEGTIPASFHMLFGTGWAS